MRWNFALGGQIEPLAMPGDRSLGGRDSHKDSAFGCRRNLIVVPAGELIVKSAHDPGCASRPIRPATSEHAAIRVQSWPVEGSGQTPMGWLELTSLDDLLRPFDPYKIDLVGLSPDGTVVELHIVRDSPWSGADHELAAFQSKVQTYVGYAVEPYRSPGSKCALPPGRSRLLVANRELPERGYELLGEPFRTVFGHDSTW